MKREFLYPPDLTFWQALQRGLVPMVEDKDYLAFVASLPCVITGERPVEVHHTVGHGLKGVGEKVSDYLSFPLSPTLHRTGKQALHVVGHKAWEELHGNQMEYVGRTLFEAVMRGVIAR